MHVRGALWCFYYVANLNWVGTQQNQQNYELCTQWRLRLACASAQSYQGLRCPPEEGMGPKLPIKHIIRYAHIYKILKSFFWCRSLHTVCLKILLSSRMTKPTKLTVCWAKTQISLGIRPVWSIFAVHMKNPWVLSYPMSTQWRLIRLGRCPGWSESWLGARVILLVLSIDGSYSLKCILDCFAFTALDKNSGLFSFSFIVAVGYGVTIVTACLVTFS